MSSMTNEELKAECIDAARNAFPGRWALERLPRDVDIDEGYTRSVEALANALTSPFAALDSAKCIRAARAALAVLAEPWSPSIAGDEPKAGGLSEEERQHVEHCKRVTGILPPVGVHTMEELTGDDERRLICIIDRLTAQPRPESELVGKLRGLVAKWRLCEDCDPRKAPTDHASELEALIGDKGGDDGQA